MSRRCSPGLIQSPEMLNPITHPIARSAPCDRARRDGRAPQDHRRAERRLACEEPLPTTAKDPTGRAQLLHRRDREATAQRRPGRRRRRGRVPRSRRVGSVQRGVPRRTEDLHDLRPGAAVDGRLRGDGNAAPDDLRRGDRRRSTTSDGRVRCTPARTSASQQFNPITLNGRQTGSSFKGITLATALDAGYSPNDRVSGGKLNVKRPGEDWNLDCSGGTLTLTDAVAKSNNCAFGRTIMSLGPGHFGDDGASARRRHGRLGSASTRASSTAGARADARRRRTRTCSTWPRRTPSSPTRACTGRRGSSRRSKDPTARWSTRPIRPVSGCCPNRSRAPRP